MDFKIGDKVVCVDDSAQPELRKGQQYTVNGLACCPKCGAGVISVSGIKNLGITYFPCCNVNANFGITVFWASRFTKPLTNKYRLEVSEPELLEIKTLKLQ